MACTSPAPPGRSSSRAGPPDAKPTTAPARSTTQTPISPGSAATPRQKSALCSTDRPSRIDRGTIPAYAVRHEAT